MSDNLDRLPNDPGPLKVFRFNADGPDHAIKETDDLIAKYEAMIDEINTGAPIDGHPLIDRILAITHNQEELMGIGKGLVKVAQLIPVLDELKIRKQAIELAKKDPNFLPWAFGDFSQDVDKLEDDFKNLVKEAN